MKLCQKCNTEQPLSEFYTVKKTGNLRPYCKTCEKAIVVDWKKANPRKALELRRRHYHLSKRPYIAYKKDHCEHCGFIPVHSCQLDVDHDDGNHSNNDPANLVTLCANCHRLKSRAHQMLEPDRSEWLNKIGFEVTQHGKV